MRQGEIEQLKARNGTGPTHDRRPCAEMGYRVWNPFEVELRMRPRGRYDEAAKGLTCLIDVLKKQREKAEAER